MNVGHLIHATISVPNQRITLLMAKKKKSIIREESLFEDFKAVALKVILCCA